LRRTLVSLFVVAGLVLAGCGGSGDDSSDSTTTTAAAKARSVIKCGDEVDGVTVSGAAGAEPEVKIDTPLKVKKSACDVLVDGTGTTAKTGDTITIRYDFFNARTGKVFDSSYSRAKDATVVLTKAFLTSIPTGLLGTKAGGRVVTVVSPADGYGPEGGQATYGIKKDDSLVFVADVISVLPALKKATGEAVAPVAGQPTVTLAANGAPTITIPKDTVAPTTLIVQPLIKSAGAAITTGQTVTVNYTGVKWSDGKVFDSSWKAGREPTTFPIGAGRVIPGWDKGLLGQTIGSQVLLIVPPAEAYGAEGVSDVGITGTETLVFVVDILNAG
jgi:peptidylprolyl isomerase